MKRIVLIAFLFIGVFISILAFNNNKNIDKVLKSSSYDYLPVEAKSYIKNIYKKTGIIIKTEKNKEENTPYLNPKFIMYLSLSEEEKKDIDLIPEVYSIEYNYNKLKSNNNLPSSYDLRNVNGNNYLTPLKNQGNSGICWAFTAMEQAESYMMLKKETSYNDSIKLLSPRQMDYATSFDGIEDYENIYGTRELNDGGNFSMLEDISSYGLSFTNESSFPFNESLPTKEVNEVLNFNNSNYELNATLEIPSISQTFNLDSSYADNCSNSDDEEACLEETKEELKEKYLDEIKSQIMTSGGGFVGVESPQAKCAFSNVDHKKAMAINDSCFNVNYGHAMQVIGWDDNYEYAYCKKTSSNSAVLNGTCSLGTKITGQGAFILRNSWGDDSEYSYVYLTYDSINDSASAPAFDFFKDLTNTSSRNWDNLYNKKLSDDGYIYGSQSINQSFTKKVDGVEKIEKVKFNTMTSDGTYTITINTNENTYKYTDIITTTYPGLYTIDLSDKNISLNNNSFSINIRGGNNKSIAVKNSISVFTSNTSDTPIIKNNIDELTIDKSSSNYEKRLYSLTKNINSDELITYKLKDSNNTDVSNYISISNNKISQNDVNTKLIVSSSIPKGNYTLVTSYNNTSEEISIIVNDNSYNITYYANNGTDNYSTQEVNKNGSFTLNENTFTKEGYLFKEWNTKSDGTGTSYNDKSSFDSIDNDLVLYAIWNPITYKISFNSNGGQGSMNNQTLTYDTKSNLTKNTFTKDNHSFENWNTKSDGTGTSYNDEEEVLNITSENNNVITLYAQWKINNCSITYYANNGTNNYTNQSVEYNKPFTLDENTFIKEGYIFTEWNTKSNGEGTTYSDQSEINGITNNLVLYAQWSPITYKVVFNPNGGEGSMSDQNMTYDQSTILNKVLFTKEDYIFINWNTKEDGTGTSYNDQNEVLNLTTENNKVINLYAIWSNNFYKITFNSNDENNSTSEQIIINNTLTKLNKNIFVRNGYTFTGWNTKEDGTGTSYTDEEFVNLDNSTILYAQWKLKYYKVFFDANGSNLTMATKSYSELEDIVLPRPSNNSTYVFVDWYKEKECINKFTDKRITKSIILYAKYRIMINKTTITPLPYKTYNGKNQTQKFYLSFNKRILVLNRDFKFTYSNNKNIGKAYINIVGINNYIGKVTKSFNILPQKIKLTKAKSNSKKKVTIQFNKIPGGVYYQVLYKQKKDKKYKTFTLKKNKITKKGFKSKKTYYIYVRGCKKVNKITYCGPLSNYKKVKVK